MKCPICQAENGEVTKACASCGSALNTRGGADIVIRKDGSVDHAGSSRWKAGGVAGAGVLAALVKSKALLFLLLKIYWISHFVGLMARGGIGLAVGGVGLAMLALLSVRRWRRLF